MGFCDDGSGVFFRDWVYMKSGKRPDAFVVLVFVFVFGAFVSNVTVSEVKPVSVDSGSVHR